MKIVLFIIIIFTNLTIAQTDWIRWGKAEVDYSLEIEGVEDNYNSETSSSPLTLLKDGYSFLISDLDGNNCPFYPTCSSFFVEAVSRTNFVKGTLMFADRFTRDSNLFKSHEHYPTHVSGKLYDPTENYQLHDSTIIFYSIEKLVN
ncbi:MAG: membrane protein insertion efficiency factor YidD [Melioribacteraceae bacterium]|nr:membrane protein insertion efficiency factor YidD [Melioribacteraceae bacterium]